MLLPIFAVWFGFWNCARGRLLFNMVTSVTITRLVATGAMAMATMILALYLHVGDALSQYEIIIFTWAALMLWCVPAWDAYWSSEIGNDPNHSRLWGLGVMGLRMTLAAPCIIGLAYLSGHLDRAVYAAGTPLLSLPYYISGYVSPVNKIIPIAEIGVGLILGILIYFTIGGIM